MATSTWDRAGPPPARIYPRQRRDHRATGLGTVMSPKAPGEGVGGGVPTSTRFCLVAEAGVSHESPGRVRSVGCERPDRRTSDDWFRCIAVTPSGDAARSHLRGGRLGGGGCGTRSLARDRLAPRRRETTFGRRSASRLGARSRGESDRQRGVRFPRIPGLRSQWREVSWPQRSRSYVCGAARSELMK